ncbi:MAG: NAD-dependent epimerase/dehydratase family protein [Gammaproteobacteria bacterium]|nr:MAG: NAD-dependent epimerase/dehydratase family protein [Gammaproteobacteria bacterium]
MNGNGYTRNGDIREIAGLFTSNKKSMNNALVVGINGTIGSALFTALAGTHVTAWGTTRRAAEPGKQTIFYLNLMDEPASWVLPDVHFDVVYLCAGICKMADCENDPATAYKINVDGMSSLAHYFSLQGSFIVYLSTNQVFSGQTPHTLPEEAYGPQNEYGRQKAQAEQSIKAACPSSAIVRLTKVVEPNMALVKNWIHQLEQHQPIEAFQDMMLAPVTLKQVIDVLISVGQKKQGGYYHVSGAQDVSYYDVAAYLVSYLNQPASLAQAVTASEKGINPHFLPRFTTLDCTSTITLTDYKPMYFSEVLHECFDNLRK